MKALKPLFRSQIEQWLQVSVRTSLRRPQRLELDFDPLFKKDLTTGKLNLKEPNLH